MLKQEVFLAPKKEPARYLASTRVLLATRNKGVSLLRKTVERDEGPPDLPHLRSEREIITVNEFLIRAVDDTTLGSHHAALDRDGLFDWLSGVGQRV